MGTLRRLTTDDIARVLEIQAAAYAPHLLETAEVFAAKITAHPAYCLGHETAEGKLSGYVVAMAMASTESVGLHETDPRPNVGNGAAPVLYIHDMAVDPAAHESGAGSAMLRELESTGRTKGQTVIELVAIESAVSFWERHGFVATGDDVYAGYGPGARKMRRAV